MGRNLDGIARSRAPEWVDWPQWLLAARWANDISKYSDDLRFVWQNEPLWIEPQQQTSHTTSWPFRIYHFNDFEYALHLNKRR